MSRGGLFAGLFYHWRIVFSVFLHEPVWAGAIRGYRPVHLLGGGFPCNGAFHPGRSAAFPKAYGTFLGICLPIAGCDDCFTINNKTLIITYECPYIATSIDIRGSVTCGDMSFIGASHDAADTIISGYGAIGNAAGDDVYVITLVCNPRNSTDKTISGYGAIGNAAGGDASVIIQACIPRNSADIIISGYDTVGNAAGDNVGTRTNYSDNATDSCPIFFHHE